MRLPSFVRCAVCIGTLLVLTSTSHALSYVQAKILELIITDGDQYARIAIGTTDIGDRPACHAPEYLNHYGFDISTPKGKALLTTATAALLAGKKVGILGSGACITVSPDLQLESVGALLLWP